MQKQLHAITTLLIAKEIITAKELEDAMNGNVAAAESDGESGTDGESGGETDETTGKEGGEGGDDGKTDPESPAK